MKKLIYILIIPFFISCYQETNLDFLFNGSIDASDSTLIDSITGVSDANYKLINVDFDTTIDSLPAKSISSLIIYSDTIPLYALNSDGLRNYNRADTLFIQQLNNSVVRIAHYSTPTIDTDNYFNTIPEPTNVINVPNDYLTINDAIVAAGTTADTIEVETGIYDEISFINWRYPNIRAIGDCEIRSTGASFVVLTSNEQSVFFSGFEINGEDNTGSALFGSSDFNNKSFINCGFKNSTTDIISIATTSSQYLNTSFENCVVSNENEIEIKTSALFNNCLIQNTRVRVTVETPNIFIDSCDLYFNDLTVDFLAFNNLVDTVIITNNNFIDVANRYTVTAINSIEHSYFEFSDNVLTVDSLSITNVASDLFSNVFINNNTFINNSNTTVPNILIREFRNLYIRDNNFETQSGNIYPISVSSTSLANEVYIERNIDSTKSLLAYFIVLGSELTAASDNNISKIVISENVGFGARYFDSGLLPTTHGLLLGFQSGNISVTHNNYNGFGLNYVFKGSTGTYSDDLNISSNISSNANNYGYYAKGVDSVKFYNNTSYLDNYAYYFTENTGSDGAINCEVINSAIETETGGYAYQFDVNSSSNFTSSNNVILSDNIAFYNGLGYNWASWQGLGQDLNSFNTDPNFKSSTQLWPIMPSDAIGNGLNLGTPYDTALNINSVFPDTIIKKQQFARWSMGAYIPPFETIDNYVTDTLMSIWADKMNQTIKIFLNSNDTIELETP